MIVWCLQPSSLPQELQENIKAIIEDCKQLQVGGWQDDVGPARLTIMFQPHEQEPPVGILTSEERDTWARLRLKVGPVGTSAQVVDIFPKLFEVDPENERSMTIVRPCRCLEGIC